IEAVLADMPDEPRTGALGHTLVEGGGQGLTEGRQRRGRTPAGCHAVVSRRVGATPAAFPACHPVLRPLLWTVSLSLPATCSSRAQDHDRQPVQPAYHETVWPATPVRAHSPPCSRGGPPGREARCLGVRACRRVLMRRPFPCTKEPFRVLFYAILGHKPGEKGAPRDPKYYTKEFQTAGLPVYGGDRRLSVVGRPVFSVCRDDQSGVAAGPAP